MHRRADAADPLRPDPGLAGVACPRGSSRSRGTSSPDAHAWRPCRRHLGLDAQVALDAGDGVNLDPRIAAPPGSAGRAGGGPLGRRSRLGAWRRARVRRLAAGSRRAAATPLAGALHDLPDAVRSDRRRDTRRRPRARPSRRSCRRRSPARSAAARRTGSSCPRSPGTRSAMQLWPACDRPARAVVPAHVGAVVGRRRALAAHLVEAVALAVALVAPLLDEQPGVEVGPPLALVVDQVAVGEQRAGCSWSSAGISPNVR